MLMTLRRSSRGFTLIELMVTIALLAILLGLAAPSFALWIKNARIRTVGDALQTGARLAQAEAIRLNRQVVFFLTNDANCGNATNAADNGNFWAIRTVPLVAGDAASTVQCGQLSEFAGGVTITADSSTAVCFNSMGRQITNTTPGVGGGAQCSPAANGSRYDIAMTGADRRVRVLISIGGQVRMCDPDKTPSDTTPDGCPAEPT